MEYCNGGSLYSILDEPINAFGLEESEFMLFLEHICESLSQKLYVQAAIICELLTIKRPGSTKAIVCSRSGGLYRNIFDFGRGDPGLNREVK